MMNDEPPAWLTDNLGEARSNRAPLAFSSDLEPDIQSF